MIKKYEKYKESGIEWLGEIPEHWKPSKLKYYANVITGNTPSTSVEEYFSDDNGVLWVKPSDLAEFNTITTSKQRLTEKGLLQSRLVRKGSVLVGGIGDIGKLGVAGCDLTTNQQIHSIEGNINKIDDDYLKYLLYSSIDELQKKSSSVVLSILTKTKLLDLEIVIPIDSEQAQIAKFLDQQTTIIDDLIGQKEKLIDLLKEKRQAIINETVTKGLNPDVKMKDSGIEWLGEIPEHWRLSKVKYEFYLKARVGWKGLTSDEFEEESYAYLVTGTDFKQRNINWKTCYQVNKERYEDDPFIILKNGDLLITKDGTIGKTSIVKDLDKPACLNSGIFVLRPLKNNVNNEFLYWIMNSSSFSIFNDLTSTGATIKHLYQNVFQEFSISIPHIEEQNEIVEYLDKQTAFVDNIIEQTVYQITKIKEYRQSIISEAVTGKIDVRDWQPNNA